MGVKNLIRFMRHIDGLYQHDIETYGLDQKVQDVLLIQFPDQNIIPKTLYRTIQEPITCRYWNSIASNKLTLSDMHELCSLLRGDVVSFRTGRSRGFDNTHGSYEFCYPIDDNWLDRIYEISDSSLPDPFEEMALIFREIIWTHPFSDGNGRLARALLNGSLARRGIISRPILGLNAIFDVFRQDIGESLRISISTGEVSLLRNTIVQCLVRAEVAIRIIGAREYEELSN